MITLVRNLVRKIYKIFSGQSCPKLFSYVFKTPTSKDQSVVWNWTKNKYLLRVLPSDNSVLNNTFLLLLLNIIEHFLLLLFNIINTFCCCCLTLLNTFGGCCCLTFLLFFYQRCFGKVKHWKDIYNLGRSKCLRRWICIWTLYCPTYVIFIL